MTEARVSEVCDRNEWVVPNLSRNHRCVPMFFVTFFLPPAATWPLGLLQWLVVLFQHGPGFGRHEAVGRVLSLASHFTHACAWDEIVILMAVIKNKMTESVRETHTKSRGALNNRSTSISEKMPINGTPNRASCSFTISWIKEQAS